MSLITVNFKNLCALFTKKLDDELMVGLLDLADFEGITEAEIHCPKITIRAKKVVNPGGDCVIIQQCWVYEGFQRTNRCCLTEDGANGTHPQHNHYESIFGKILFMVPGVAPGLNLDLSPEKIDDLTKSENEKRPMKNPIEVDVFSKTLDIENTLYKGRPLVVRPEFCKARFHFQHGTLYSIRPVGSPPIMFEPGGSGADGTDGKYAIEAGLEIEVPENHYAVMRFLNTDTRDFVFQGGQRQNYSVTIENSPISHQHGGGEEGDPDHFQYYYRLVDPDQLPDPIYRLSETTPPTGDPFCMISGFGRANY